MSAKKIGLFGGTFNPIHLGHLVLAEQAREALGLAEVWFMPVAEPPLKHDPALAPAAARAAMVGLAIAGHAHFVLKEDEVHRGGISYTIETMRAFHQTHGASVAWWLLTGSDACETLPRWKQVDALLGLCQVVAAIRPGYARARLPKQAQILEMPLLEVSATEIRQRIASGRSIRFLVPDAVRQYIAEQQLYQHTQPLTASP